MRITEEKMETTIMGFCRVKGSGFFVSWIES